MLIETWHALGMPEVVERELQLKKYDRGPSESEWVEVMTVLPLVGGKTLEDLRILKEDSGVMRLWPTLGKLSARSALDFLERFHDPKQAGSTLGKAVIRVEPAPLRKLGAINRALVAEVQRRKVEEVATIDVDASVHESRKREALPHYEGGRGYQPVIAVWAERRPVVGNQFRDGVVREEGRCWAEVEYIPEETRPKGTPPFRYLAIRLPKQREVFEDPPAKYVAVVTNRWKVEGNELINWHREKCGTVEHLHDLLKNDLAARCFPSGKYGVNAAWYRFNVLANNLQVACALLALDDKDAARVRPSTFTFRFVRRAGRIISHARTLFLVLCSLSAPLLPLYEEARARLVDLVGTQ